MAWFVDSTTSLLALCIVAQVDTISGGAGWVGTGLLGAVLSWLLFVHLPAKDKQLRDVIHEHTETEKEQRSTHSALEREQRADFSNTLKAMMDHSRVQFTDLANALREDLDMQRQGLETLQHAMEALTKEVLKR